MYRLINRRIGKAVGMTLVILSLLFYVLGLHAHYMNRALTILGALKEAPPDIQQAAVQHIMREDADAGDGRYVLMKNGYHKSGYAYLLWDPYALGSGVICVIVAVVISKTIKHSSMYEASVCKDELDYLKKGVERFLYDGEEERKEAYEACNDLLDRLKYKRNDTDEQKASEIKRMMILHQNIVHQIKTPLQSLTFLVENLSMQGKLDEQSEELMYYSIWKAVGLANIYMKASKFDSGKVIYQYEPVELRELIEEIVQALDVYARHYRTKVTVRGAPVSVYADAVWLKEAIQNIVKNAIEYAGEEKQVEITCMSDETHATIWVDDNGDPEEIVDDTVFERYESSSAGIGIGLHLCKQIIKTHLGDIKIERSPLGGLRFVIRLPIQNQKTKIEKEEYECES